MTPNESTGSCPRLTRRAFLQHVEAGALALTGVAQVARVALPVLVTACGGARFAASSVEGSRLAIDLAEFGSNDSALIDVPGGELPIHVRRRPDGTFAALSTRCMHQGCQVDRSGDRFICPCHGSEYTIDGAVLKGPTERPLIGYRTSADGKRAYVHLDAPLAAEESL